MDWINSFVTGLSDLVSKVIGLDGKLDAAIKRIDSLDAEVAALKKKLEGGPVTPPPPVEPPPPTASSGDIFYKVAQVIKLVMSGDSWKALAERATGGWQTPTFWGESASNNAQGDADAVSAALYVVRTGDQTILQKLRAHLTKAATLDSNWLLGLSRQLPGYVEAASLIGFHPPEFVNWVHSRITKSHGSGQRWGSLDTILITGLSFNSNWGIMSMRAIVTASLYLLRYGNTAQKADAQKWLRLAVLQYKRFVGEPGDYSELPALITATNGWGGSTGPGYGVNPEGSTFVTDDGVVHDGSGILQADWLRAKIKAGLPGAGSEDRDARYYPPQPVTYHWEGLTALIVLAAILHEHGLVHFSAGNNAIVRAVKALMGQSNNDPAFYNPPQRDDLITLHIVHHYTGIDFGKSLDNEPDKAGFGWMTWYYS